MLVKRKVGKCKCRSTATVDNLQPQYIIRKLVYVCNHCKEQLSIFQETSIKKEEFDKIYRHDVLGELHMIKNSLDKLEED